MRTKWFKVNIFKAASGNYRWSVVQGDSAVASGIAPTKGKAIVQSRTAEHDLVRRFGYGKRMREYAREA